MRAVLALELLYLMRSIEARKKRSTYDQEFYSLVWALKQWEHYFMKWEFVFYTDHQVLNFSEVRDIWIACAWSRPSTCRIFLLKSSTSAEQSPMWQRSSVVEHFYLRSFAKRLLQCLKELYKEDKDFGEIWTSVQRNDCWRHSHLRWILILRKSTMHSADFLAAEVNSRFAWQQAQWTPRAK